MQDALLKSTLTLPNGAATTTSSGIDMQGGQQLAGVELRFDAPAVPIANLGNTEAITYTLEGSSASNFATVGRTVSLGVQTGATANAVAAAIANGRYRLASNDLRYWRLKSVKTGAGTNASTLSATLIVESV